MCEPQLVQPQNVKNNYFSTDSKRPTITVELTLVLMPWPISIPEFNS